MRSHCRRLPEVHLDVVITDYRKLSWEELGWRVKSHRPHGRLCPSWFALRDSKTLADKGGSSRPEVLVPVRRPDHGGKLHGDRPHVVPEKPRVWIAKLGEGMGSGRRMESAGGADFRGIDLSAEAGARSGIS